jgi:hypothetical protein
LIDVHFITFFHSQIAPQNDYGKRAHEDLIVTRGAGFRKEKNKKKKGSYRGGEITVCSIQLSKIQLGTDERDFGDGEPQFQIYLTSLCCGMHICSRANRAAGSLIHIMTESLRALVWLWAAHAQVMLYVGLATTILKE